MKSQTKAIIRRGAKNSGLKLQKCRSRNKVWPGYGTYCSMNGDRNEVVFGRNQNTVRWKNYLTDVLEARFT